MIFHHIRVRVARMGVVPLIGAKPAADDREQRFTGDALRQEPSSEAGSREASTWRQNRGQLVMSRGDTSKANYNSRGVPPTSQHEA